MLNELFMAEIRSFVNVAIPHCVGGNVVTNAIFILCASSFISLVLKVHLKVHLNLQKRKFYLPEEDMWITLKVTAKTLRTINKKGISATLRDAAAGKL